MTERKYLTEVQGLRTVAALLVAIYHIWLQRVSGGVDVFFVVSAYFLVAGLMRREPMRFGDLFAQLMSTIRRIVPGTAIVVVGTVVGGILFLPAPLWGGGLAHGLLSLGYLENWLLARDATYYLAPGLTSSPFQQMWALSVQMQVLLALPIVYFFCSLLGRLFWGQWRAITTLVFAAIFIGSLWLSITLTAENQVVAYYLTPTRIWEFMAGGVAALWIERVRMRPRVATIVGYAGLLVLVTFGLVVDVSRQFPGFLAAVPVLCALAIIAASMNGGDIKPLNNRVAVRLADMSFAFYLWHWPLLVFVRQQMNSSDVGVVAGLGIIVAAGLLAYASTNWIEAPVRRAAWLVRWPVLSLVVAVAFIGLAGGALKGWQSIYAVRTKEAAAAFAAFNAAPEVPLAPGQIVPDPIISNSDSALVYRNNCEQQTGRTALIQCVYGDPDATTTLVLVGGSHASQWSDAFDAIGKADGYRVVVMSKSACTFFVGDEFTASCRNWAKEAMAAIIALHPDLVVALVTRTNAPGAPETVPESHNRAFKELEANGIRMLGLRDTPRFGFNAANCVSIYRSTDIGRCARPRAVLLGAVDQLKAQLGPNIHFVDTSNYVCDAQLCPPVVDGILRYRDDDHLTRTFVMQLEDELAAETKAALAEAG